MSRAFLICPEPVRAVTAGVGTRFATLARVLADAGHGVTLAIPNDTDEAPRFDGVDVIRAEPTRLGSQADDHDWVLLHAHLGNSYLSQRDDLPLVVDLYDPFLVENLHYHRDLGLTPFSTDHDTWRLQMGRGDFFLCSSEEQRLYYLGWLSALGRVNPLSLEDDPKLRRLIVELPFGVPEAELPAKPERADVLPGVDIDAPVLYFGGIYDWYDPLTVLDAMPALLERDPRTVLVFVEHPHPDLTPLTVAGRIRREAERRGWLGSSVRFEQWRPYDRRFEVAQAADVAVVTHRAGLETDLSLRTRLVDLLWLGLPTVVTEGGTMARVVAESGAGEVVPEGAPAAVAAAVATLLDNPQQRESAADAGRKWAADRRWSLVAKPLLEFADNPWRDGHRERFSELAPGQVAGDEPLLQKLQRALRRKRGSR
ncbi:MAG: glycosyltransferase [Acidobacteria bacterium]|jgi:glycosyltransferase involved in cell wall biosynthesis|nr:glycosyltransferase [Acidobacteriota bacterium]